MSCTLPREAPVNLAESTPRRPPAVGRAVRGPGADVQVASPVIERPRRSRPRQRLAVRAHVVGGPCEPPGGAIRPVPPAMDAELAPRRSTHHPAPDEVRRA